VNSYQLPPIAEEKRAMKKQYSKTNGFTLIEIIAVIVIIAIAALIAIPVISSASGTQLRSAANMIAADLEYAKSMAISRQKPYKVIFDKNANSYRIQDQTGVIGNPFKPGSNYIVTFSTDSSLSRVGIVNVNFAGASQVEFNYLGSPDNGGVVNLAVGTETATITVEPVTGFITISD
jgi:prepilin-type N-terminal cleavage/methylation domain-containing protein